MNGSLTILSPLLRRTALIMTALKIGAVQPPLRSPEEDPIEHTRTLVLPLLKDCANVDLYVLPELSPIGYTQDTFDRYLHRPEIQQEIDAILAQAARESKAYIAYGRIAAGNGKSFTIQQCVLNGEGTVVARYDKQLLCNYGGCAETNYFTAGTDLCSFDCKGFCIGLLICADMRNPTWSRQLAKQHKVDIILQPAAFSRDLSFRTWKSFRETRAVENSVYWVGVNYAGNFYGNSSIVPPWVDEDCEPSMLGTKEGVLEATISRDVLNQVRTSMPYYQLLLCEDK
jgi:predicted amidohydrolase